MSWISCKCLYAYFKLTFDILTLTSMLLFTQRKLERRGFYNSRVWLFFHKHIVYFLWMKVQFHGFSLRSIVKNRRQSFRLQFVFFANIQILSIFPSHFQCFIVKGMRQFLLYVFRGKFNWNLISISLIIFVNTEYSVEFFAICSILRLGSIYSEVSYLDLKLY